MTEPCARAAEPSAGSVDPRDFWEQRYVQRNTPWDLGGAPPVLVRTIAGFLSAPSLRVLVPGAGVGHDAFAWAGAGHAVTAVDLAPSACRALEARARRTGLPVRILEADVLALPPETRAAFDLVWEQTCLCALPPDRHADYVRAMADALRPEGLYVGLFWNHGQAGGPPFDLAPDLVRSLLEPRFTVLVTDPVPDSPPGRSHEFTCRGVRARV